MKKTLVTNPPCQFCKKRHTNCHDSCSEYQKFKRDRQIILDKKSLEYYLNYEDRIHPYKKK